MWMIEHDDGDIAIVNDHELFEEAKRLVAIMLTMSKVSKENAGIELMRISAETNSPAYVQALAQKATQLAMQYVLEEATPFHVAIIMSNLHKFVLAYRVVRPVPEKDDGDDRPAT